MFCFFSASATSFPVTAPKSRPFSPMRTGISTVTFSSCAAMSFASSTSIAFLRAFAPACAFATFTFDVFAGSASFLGRRKLRP